jgi:hypothetical protein
MKKFTVTSTLEAGAIVSSNLVAGEIYFVEHNPHGGSNSTPVARYFAWKPETSEGFHAHWRIDCFLRKHKLSPKPLPTGEALVAALVKEQLCDEPMWLSVHMSEELEGKAYGEVFDLD